MVRGHLNTSQVVASNSQILFKLPNLGDLTTAFYVSFIQKISADLYLSILSSPSSCSSIPYDLNFRRNRNAIYSYSDQMLEVTKLARIQYIRETCHPAYHNTSSGTNQLILRFIAGTHFIIVVITEFDDAHYV